MSPQDFVNALAAVQLPSVFNPYRDRCMVHDHVDAATRRRRNLESFITAALTHRVDTIWVARDLGYRGGRRTGIPLTDEIHLDRISSLLGGISMERATHGPAFAERTASVVWEALSQINQPVVLWNIFPLHPHTPNNPFSNRAHTIEERNATSFFLPALVEIIKPKQIVAIGRDAQKSLRNMDIHVVNIRHPSYGGQREFMIGLSDLHDVS